MKVTQRDLDQAVNVLNRTAKTPLEPYTTIDGKFTPNANNYHLDSAYGGVKLVQMMPTGSGVRDVFRCGYVTKRELYRLVNAYALGIESK